MLFLIQYLLFVFKNTITHYGILKHVQQELITFLLATCYVELWSSKNISENKNMIDSD